MLTFDYHLDAIKYVLSKNRTNTAVVCFITYDDDFEDAIHQTNPSQTATFALVDMDESGLLAWRGEGNSSWVTNAIMFVMGKQPLVEMLVGDPRDFGPYANAKTRSHGSFGRAFLVDQLGMMTRGGCQKVTETNGSYRAARSSVLSHDNTTRTFLNETNEHGEPVW